MAVRKVIRLKEKLENPTSGVLVVSLMFNNDLKALRTHISATSMTYDRDSGHKSFLEDVFENESRLPGGSWGPSSVPWTDVVSISYNSGFDHTAV